MPALMAPFASRPDDNPEPEREQAEALEDLHIPAAQVPVGGSDQLLGVEIEERGAKVLFDVTPPGA